MKFLVTIILSLPFYLCDKFIMYHTRIKTSSGYDCLYYSYGTGTRDVWVEQLTPYCVRPSIQNKSLPLSNHSYITFAQLKKDGISSADLLAWMAPQDVAEDFEIYLQDTNRSRPLANNRYYNCSNHFTGPQCEYYFPYPEGTDFSDSLDFFFSIKNQDFQPAATDIPCYVHLSCVRRSEPLCLDWREVCDGKVDCLNGEDEVDCWQLEANRCTENEYRCYSGHCIPDQFYRDEHSSPDCMDGSDEADWNYDDCASSPQFRCEEHTCYSSLDNRQFACGDGQCISKFSKCVNKRENIPYLAEYVSRGNLSYDCWKSMACLTGYFMDDEDKDCGYFCWGACAPQIVDKCPQYIQFPNQAVIFEHVYLVYTKNAVDIEREAIGDPTFLCYNINKCGNNLYPVMYILGQHCIYYDRLNLTLNSSHAWNYKIGIIARIFSNICEPVSTSFSCPDKTLYQCAHTKKCISVHRLIDGVVDCDEGDDETFGESCSLGDSAGRFQCSNEKKCLSIRMINNGRIDCKEGDDELHPHERISPYRITFSTICDGFQDLKPILIDGKNETDETNCEHWLCNNTYTHCDGIWNCRNGADEIGCRKYTFVCPPLHHYCVNRTTEKITCLPISKANDGEIDCLGGSDEIIPCQILESQMCPYKWMRPYRCAYQVVRTGLRCQNDTACIYSASNVSQKRLSCQSGREETNVFFENTISRCSLEDQDSLTDAEKLLCNIWIPQQRWSYYYFQIAETFSSTQISTTSLSLFSARKKRLALYTKLVWYCHRGMPTVVSYDGFTTTELRCFCPPSYYGDFCQYQNERISLSISIRMSAEWKTLFTLIYFLINDHDEIESHDQLYYSSAAFCGVKINRYLLYSTRPKSLNRSYSVHIEAYNRKMLEYRASWRFNLQFAFLPVQRLAIQLHIPIRRLQCFLDCGMHGQCSSFVNTKEIFCKCDSGWTGKRCELPQEKVCNCSPDSLCLFNRICVCPMNRYGERCYLPSPVYSNRCKNNGTCVYLEPRSDSAAFNYICLSSDGFYADTYTNKSDRITISFQDVAIPSLIFLHFIEVIKEKEPKRTDILKKIPVSQESTIVYISFKFQILFLKFDESYYLAYLQRSDSPKPTEIILRSRYYCPSISQVFKNQLATLPLLQRIKHYHIPCQTDHKLHCFYDDQHMCLCEEEHRANCLTFEHNKTSHCEDTDGDCENGAQCFQDRKDCPYSSVCLCPKCYYGSKCQFSAYGLSLSLDAILGYHIQPNVPMKNQSTLVKVSISLTIVVLVLGTISCLLSILTFRKPQSQAVGCGLYLLGASFSSLISIWTFAWKFFFLLIFQMQVVTDRSISLIQCVSCDFFLQVSFRFSDWFIVCVAIERGASVLQGVRFNQSKSKQIAKQVYFILPFFIVSTTIYDSFFRKLIEDEEEQRIWCVVHYSETLQIFNSVLHFFHFLVPFIMNLISALIVITMIVRSRGMAHKNISMKKHLVQQLRKHKHLFISPILLTILALPRFIIAISSDCMTSARDPYLYIAAYFIPIIPPMLIFVIFVLTSETYKKAFVKSVQKWLPQRRFRH